MDKKVNGFWHQNVRLELKTVFRARFVERVANPVACPVTAQE